MSAPHLTPGLERYRWKARVLVISAPSDTDPALAAQQAALAADAAGLKERDLVVIELIGDRAPPVAPGLDPAIARRAAGLGADRFGVALVGKDGRVAERRAAPIEPSSLFRLIDSMPMRRDERRRR